MPYTDWHTAPEEATVYLGRVHDCRYCSTRDP